MAAKKPEKSKSKQNIKGKKSGKEKRPEPKSKIKAKSSEKKSAARGAAVEKVKAKVRTVLEKVTAKVAKTVQPAATGKGKIAAPSKSAKIAVPAKVEKAAGQKGGKVEKIVAKGLKPGKGTKKTEAPVVAPPAGKKGAKAGVADVAKAEVSAKKHAAAKNRCREVGCDNEGFFSGYCRLHYIKNWRRIKKKESILSTGQLDGYVEELVAKYPDKYLDAIENDLASEKEWAKVISDLELGAGTDEDFVAEDDDSPITEATGRARGGGFDDEDEDIY